MTTVANAVTESKRGRGRPSQNRERRIMVRLNDEEFSAITEAAREAGIPFGTFLRSCALRAARERE